MSNSGRCGFKSAAEDDYKDSPAFPASSKCSCLLPLIRDKLAQARAGSNMAGGVREVVSTLQRAQQASAALSLAAVLLTWSPIGQQI